MSNETLQPFNVEVRFFLQVYMFSGSIVPVKTQKFSHVRKFYFQIKYSDLNEQLLS